MASFYRLMILQSLTNCSESKLKILLPPPGVLHPFFSAISFIYLFIYLFYILFFPRSRWFLTHDIFHNSYFNRFDMPAPTLTLELKKDLQLLKLRGAIDIKRYYKKDSKSKALPN